MYDLPHSCPVCSGELHVARAVCSHCGTSIEGEFANHCLMRLSPAQKAFTVSFLKNRGSIKDMERELGVSYPTVRARLDEIISALGETPASGMSRKEVLSMLARGEINAQEAQSMLLDSTE